MGDAVSEAISQYKQSLQIDSEDADAHNNLGVALADQGKLGDAIAQALA